MLDYNTHVKNKSLYNTPNTWGIYILNLVCKWLKEKGGLVGMQQENEAKAKLIYDAIDATDFYRGHADPDSRSMMNVTLPYDLICFHELSVTAGFASNPLSWRRAL